MIRILSLIVCMLLLFSVFAAIPVCAAADNTAPTSGRPLNEPEPDDYRNIVPYIIIFVFAMVATAVVTLLTLLIIHIVKKAKRNKSK